MLLKAKQRVVTGLVEISFVEDAFLLAINQALRAIQVPDDSPVRGPLPRLKKEQGDARRNETEVVRLEVVVFTYDSILATSREART